MTRIVLLTQFFLIAGITVLAAQPTSNHEKLKALEGSWTIEGLQETYLEVCTLYDGGYFLVCNTDFKSKTGNLNRSVSIIGFDERKQQLTYYHYGSGGNQQTLTGSLDDKGNFYFNGEDVIDGKPAKTKISLTPDGSNYRFTEQTSVGNGPYEETNQFLYIRVK